jgi:hypothetical protein
MTVTMMNTEFWDVTPCDLVEAIRRFGGSYGLHLQGRIISPADTQATLILGLEHGGTISETSVKSVLFILSRVGW